MKRYCFGMAVVCAIAVTAIAQRSADRPGPPAGPLPAGPQRGFPPGPPGGFSGPPGFHLMAALDTDRNGKISTKEIDNAVAALQTLDKNKDGKLSADEIGWPPAGGFGGRRGGFPGPGGPGGAPGAERPQRPEADADGARPAGDQPRKGGSREKRFFSVAQLKTLDRNEDGKITKDEIPRRLQDLILNRVDANKDDVIDLDELSRVGQPPDNNQGKGQP